MRYTKKPVVVEAWELKPSADCIYAMLYIIGDEAYKEPDGSIKIKTLEGVMTASTGDFIIKGVNGEFYPCKPDVFHKTYERHDVKMNDSNNKSDKKKFTTSLAVQVGNLQLELQKFKSQNTDLQCKLDLLCELILKQSKEQ